MDILEGIFTRRSIRRFTQGQISQEQLHLIIKAGCQGPSAHNLQPWHFIVINDRNTFESIMKFHAYAKMLSSADTCIIVCGDEKRQPTTGFLIEDCSAAIENMLLAVHGIGLGAVWCGLYPVTQLTGRMKKLLSIPPRIIPVGMIVIGQIGEQRAAEDRFDENKIHYGQW